MGSADLKTVTQDSLLDWMLLNIFACDCGRRKEGRKRVDGDVCR